jgi:ATP-dependent Clp protease ATP-binding subunit ClpA
MDHATLTDNNGRKADFRNVILIMTTNAGAREMSRGNIGFSKAQASGGLGEALSSLQPAGKEIDETKAKGALERTFSPEFRNRLDAWILFHGLTREVILRVVDKEIAALQAQLFEKKVTLALTDAARHWLAERGYDPAFGARPMGRLVEERIKRPLAEALLFGALAQGGRATVDVDGAANELTLAFLAAG